MKKVLLIDGGLRHILFYLGCVYMTFVIMSTFGMFKSLFEDEAGMISVSFVIGSLFAWAMEVLFDKLYGKPSEIGGSIFSWPDVRCSSYGVLLGGIIYVLIPDSLVFGIIATLLMAFALLDYRHRIVQSFFL